MKSIFNVSRLAIGLVTVLLFGGTVGADSKDERARPPQSYINPSAVDTIEWLPEAQADHRILYGNNSLWFGDLRLPKGRPPKGGYPVVVFVHGGGWSSSWSLDYSVRLVDAITNLGVATWNLEFRRLGNSGGGWPGTFLDVARGTDYLRTLATKYPLDLNRVVVAGHSSGGHLVTWLAGRHRLPPESPLYTPDPLLLKGVLSLAGIPDLEGAVVLGRRLDVLELLGVATEAEAAERYDDASPKALLPHGVPQSHIVGTLDNAWRIAITIGYGDFATSIGEDVEVTILEGANHFDVVDPCGPAWPTIGRAVLALLGEDSKVRTPGSRACPPAESGR